MKRLPIVLFALPGLASAADPTPLGTWTWDLGAFDFNGPGISVSAFGPEVGEPLWHAHVDVEFDANGAMPAADLLFQVVLPLEGTTAVWSFTGADLGFPATGGSFSGSLDSDLFDGVVANPSPFPNVPMDVLVSTVAGPTIGHLERFTVTFEIGPRLETDTGSVSLSAGGSQNLHLNAGPTEGPGAVYLILGSASGTSPGLTIDGVVVPLEWDPYMNLLLVGPNPAFLPGSFGVLDANGTADAPLQVPPGSNPGLAGLTLHHSFLVVELPAGPLLSASNAVPVVLTP